MIMKAIINKIRLRRFKLFNILLTSLLALMLLPVTPLVYAGDSASSLTYEAEAEGNTLTGHASVSDCAACSGGKKVGGLYQGSSLTFQHVTVPESGIYKLTISYISGDPRPLSVSVNGAESDSFSPPKTVDWDTVGQYTVDIALNQGANTIRIDDAGDYAPDIDKITLVHAGGDGGGGSTPGAAVYEAEASGNVLAGNAKVSTCAACSGGKKVGDMYNGSSVTFNDVMAAADGVYTMRVYYISGDPRPFSIQVNQAELGSFSPPKTTDWDTVGQFELELELKAGANTIIISDNNGYSPDIDSIRLERRDGSNPDPGQGEEVNIGKLVSSKKYGKITVAKHTEGFAISSVNYQVQYQTRTGLAQYQWAGKTVAKGIYSEVQLDASGGGKTVKNTDYTSHQIEGTPVAFKDAIGKGIQVTFVNRQAGLPSMKQHYYLYESGEHFLTQTVIESSSAISTNYLAPLVINRTEGIDIGKYDDNRVLVVPFDNDMWVRFQSKSMNTYLNTDNYISSELTAIYDNTSRRGLIIGSVTHDTWKTGISWSGANNRLNKLSVFGGFTSKASTHDVVEHGKVSGKQIASPKIMVGYYSDYRSGLEAYGKANAAIAPPLVFGKKVPSSVPFGWNSWGAHESELSYDIAVKTSDYYKAKLQHNGFTNKGDVYINLDSYWDNMSDAELAKLVKHIHNNGQRAGIYYAPFVYWGNDMNQVVEGTNGKYKYGDIVLRDNNGEPLPTVDGAYAVDTTHPGAKQRIDHYMNRFKKLGFEFIKLDFLSHGAFEGIHYDKKIETGIQAYNLGMAYVNKVLDGKMFISASIAPMFPSQYAHSRRISSDIDGSISRTEYQLNSQTYGWWQNGTIYHYTDPDYMTLAKDGTFEGAQSRVNAAVISGTVFLGSDDVRDQNAQKLMEALLTNKEVNKVAKLGKAFRPIEGNTGLSAADMFILKDKNDYYVALFNYSDAPVERNLNFARAGIEGGNGKTYEVTNLWTGKKSKVKGEWKVSLKARESVLVKLQLK